MRAPLPLFALALLLTSCDRPDPAGSSPVAPTNVVAEARKGGQAFEGSALADTNPDRVLVMFRGGPPARLAQDVEALGGTLEFQHRVGIAAVRGLDAAGLQALGAMRSVLAVTEDVVYELTDRTMAGPRTFGSAARGGAARSADLDPRLAPLLPRQWHLMTIGADAAWANGRFGSASTTIAILDTGIDGAHPDLVGRVDEARSISYVAIDDEEAQARFPDRHVTTDLHYHGTHVAATAVSNGAVAAGVARDVSLMAVRVCTFQTNPSTCATVDVLRGILYAADQGADVINLSLGGGFDKRQAGALTSLVQRVLNYANQRGATVVVAAGNEARDMDHDGSLFSAYCDGSHAICVSSTDPSDGLAVYSNYGRSTVTVAAPGGGGLSGEDGIWAACSTTSLYFPICTPGNFALSISGTSMAAPHVAGLAALLVDEVGRNPARIRARIMQGATDLGQRGTDPAFGKGRISVPGSLGF